MPWAAEGETNAGVPMVTAHWSCRNEAALPAGLDTGKTLDFSGLETVNMRPAMSLLAAALYYPYYAGFNVWTFLANWLKLVCFNFPFAYFTQLFFIQPAVRTIFKFVFRRDIKARPGRRGRRSRAAKAHAGERGRRRGGDLPADR